MGLDFTEKVTDPQEHFKEGRIVARLDINEGYSGQTHSAGTGGEKQQSGMRQ